MRRRKFSRAGLLALSLTSLIAYVPPTASAQRGKSCETPLPVTVSLPPVVRPVRSILMPPPPPPPPVRSVRLFEAPPSGSRFQRGVTQRLAPPPPAVRVFEPAESRFETRFTPSYTEPARPYTEPTRPSYIEPARPPVVATGFVVGGLVQQNTVQLNLFEQQVPLQSPLVLQLTAPEQQSGGESREAAPPPVPSVEAVRALAAAHIGKAYKGAGLKSNYRY